MPLWEKGFDHLERVVTDKPGCLVFRKSPVFQADTVEGKAPIATGAPNALAVVLAKLPDSWREGNAETNIKQFAAVGVVFPAD